MHATDEQIAKLATEQIEAERSTSITGGPKKINGRLVSFKQTPVLEGKLFVYLPESFTDMPESLAKIKYPSSDRPKTIKADERGAVAFTFCLLDSPLENKTVPELVEGMKGILQRLNPSYIFFDSGVLEAVDYVKEGYLEYKSPAIDDEMYNVMYFDPVDGMTMMGTFSCPYGEYEEWKPAVDEILNLLEVEDEEDEKDA
jgi:hypothetical protein